MSNTDRLFVYFDTSAWNFFCDWLVGKSKNRLAGPEYLFSSCNLDEFSGSGHHRARELASLAWDLSNRQKLLDHVELTVHEICNYQRGVPTSIIYDNDPTFQTAWRTLRTSGIRVELKNTLNGIVKSSKQEYRNGLRLERQVFKHVFESLRSMGLQKPWPEILQELEAEEYIARMLTNLIVQEGYSHEIPDLAGITKIPYRKLPGTAAWVQYYLALFYLASFDGGKDAKPDLGDQVDFRHACYAGISDVYATADTKMYEILTEMVENKHSIVLKPEEYLGWLEKHRATESI